MPERQFKVRVLVPVEITVKARDPAQAGERARGAYADARNDLAGELRSYGRAVSAVFGPVVEPEIAQLSPAYEPPSVSAPTDAEGCGVL